MSCWSSRYGLRFNPFFIRASVYCTPHCSLSSAIDRRFQSLLHQGISLLLITQFRKELQCVAFQSLLHQGISLLGSIGKWAAPTSASMFQSLLHQGISLLSSKATAWRSCRAWVSIPSSSGHQFTEGHRWRPNHISAPFQSLLHQGISLLASERRCVCRAAMRSFNPFFIRASVYCDEQDRRFLWKYTRFQSLLHQGISLLAGTLFYSRSSHVVVSIPSSSGHQFTASSAASASSSTMIRFNPFFIRASVY